jgi:hypothetical protein
MLYLFVFAMDFFHLFQEKKKIENKDEKKSRTHMFCLQEKRE